MDFEKCCFDAQKFVDNCDLLNHNGDLSASTSESSKQNLDMNALVDLIVNMLRQDSRIATNLEMITQDGEKWCSFCVKWTDYE